MKFSVRLWAVPHTSLDNTVPEDESDSLRRRRGALDHVRWSQRASGDSPGASPTIALAAIELTYEA